MKNINIYIQEAFNFTLSNDQRSALCEFIGIVCGNLGTDEDREKYKKVIGQLSDSEMEELNSIYDVLEDTQTYKKITKKILNDNDRYRIKKLYHILDDNDLFDEENQWDLIDAFETILGLN